MKINYFSKNRKRRHLLEKLKQKRLIVNNFHFPLGVTPDDNIMPTEGYTVDFENTDDGDRYFYNISISSDRLAYFFVNIMKLFPCYVSVIIERFSDDINKEYDSFLSDPDISLKEAKNIFLKYKELWVECGATGFGIADERSGFEVFIDFDKQVEIVSPTKKVNDVNKMLERFFIIQNEKVVFVSDIEHWNSSLFSLISYESIEKNNYEKYAFDYYYITNNLKQVYGLSLINQNDVVYKVRPKWWEVTVKCLGKCRGRTFAQTYYIVGETIEEMETVLDEEMLRIDIEYYYIYDYYNVSPDIEDDYIPFERKQSVSFKNAKCGIWAVSSDIFLGNVKDITSYLMNKPYATAHQKSI